MVSSLLGRLIQELVGNAGGSGGLRIGVGGEGRGKHAGAFVADEESLPVTQSVGVWGSVRWRCSRSTSLGWVEK